MKWKILFIIPLLFVGCVHDLIGPENPQEERILTKASDSESLRTLSLSSWTRTGTSYRTMQIRVSPALVGPVTVSFDLNPITDRGQKLAAIMVNPCVLPAGQNFMEVDIPLDAAVWRELEYNAKKDEWEYKDKTTTTFAIQIKSIAYEGDTEPLYIDQSVWQIKKAFEAETYGWDINRLSGGGQKNYGPPYDVIGDPGSGGSGGTGTGGGGGHGPVDPPSRPTE